MGHDKKEKHVHTWKLRIKETPLWNPDGGIDHQYDIQAICECGTMLASGEIEEILNKFYKG